MKSQTIPITNGSVKVRVRELTKRTIFAVSLLLGVLLCSFILFNVAPGDPARVILGPTASEEAVKELRRHLGTDRPLWEQWETYIARVIRLDLGSSIIDGRSVIKEVIDKFLVTAKIGAIGAVIALFFSYFINIIVYLYPRASFFIKAITVGVITPTFFSGVMAALAFGIWFPIVPLTGYSTMGAGWTALLLPSAIVAFYPVAVMTRLLHRKILAVSATDCARAAEAFGFSKWRVFHQTLLRPVAVSWLAAWVNQISIVFIASFIVEVIFSIPGVGPLLISTIQRKDYPMLQGILLINAIFFITLSWLSEAIFHWIDPRVRQNVAT